MDTDGISASSPLVSITKKCDYAPSGSPALQPVAIALAIAV